MWDGRERFWGIMIGDIGGENKVVIISGVVPDFT